MSTMIRDGMWCDRTPDSYRNLWHCGYVYRNPDGTRQNKDEYMRIMAGFVCHFSVEE